jgi:hypothetical protein
VNLHDVSWHLVDQHTDLERAARLADDEMHEAIKTGTASPDKECVHGMPIAWCVLCRQPRPGVLPQGYRTKEGSAYHNDPDCEWLLKGQQRASRQGKSVHDKVRIAWGSVEPGELEPCESCCTLQWLKRHGY